MKKTCYFEFKFTDGFIHTSTSPRIERAEFIEYVKKHGRYIGYRKYCYVYAGSGYHMKYYFDI